MQRTQHSSCTVACAYVVHLAVLEVLYSVCERVCMCSVTRNVPCTQVIYVSVPSLAVIGDYERKFKNRKVTMYLFHGDIL